MAPALSRILLAWTFFVYACYGYMGWCTSPRERIDYPIREVCEAARRGAVEVLGPSSVSDRCEEAA
jgi:hypothetical protein